MSKPELISYPPTIKLTGIKGAEPHRRRLAVSVKELGREGLGLTTVGLQAKRLVSIDHLLGNLSREEANFAASPEIVTSLEWEREALCQGLELPNNPQERKKVIEGFKGKLTQLGFPYWRINH